MLSKEQLESTIDCHKKHCNDCKMFKEVDVKYIGCIGLVTKTALELLDQVEAQQQEIENIKSLSLIKFMSLKNEIEQLKAQNAAYREKEQEFVELYEANPCDFLGEVPSLMDLHHRFYCIFKEIVR